MRAQAIIYLFFALEEAPKIRFSLSIICHIQEIINVPSDRVCLGGVDVVPAYKPMKLIRAGREWSSPLFPC